MVRFLGHRFGITCHSSILNRIDAKTLFSLIIEDTQQQTQRDDQDKVFKSVLAALAKLQGVAKVQATIAYVQKADQNAVMQGPPQFESENEVRFLRLMMM